MWCYDPPSLSTTSKSTKSNPRGCRLLTWTYPSSEARIESSLPPHPHITKDPGEKKPAKKDLQGLVMASAAPFSTLSGVSSSQQPSATAAAAALRPAAVAFPSYGKRPASRVVATAAGVGELSSDSTAYLVAGAIAVALVGTAFPIFFSRKDICPECDGAGFIRQSGVALRANAARKDQSQIVCPRCNGLGKLGQIDK